MAGPAILVAIAGATATTLGLLVTFPDVVKGWVRRMRAGRDATTKTVATTSAQAWRRFREAVARLPGVPPPSQTVKLGRVKTTSTVSGLTAQRASSITTSAEAHVWPSDAPAGERVDLLYNKHIELVKKVHKVKAEAEKHANDLVGKEREEREGADTALNERVSEVESSIREAEDAFVEVNMRGLIWVLTGTWAAALAGLVASWWLAALATVVLVGGSLRAAWRSIRDHRDAGPVATG